MRDTVRFVLNGEIVAIAGIDPATTMLQWLRNHRRMTGTKEGCAEGDCGACTIVVGERHGDGVRYKAINACIALIGMIDGRIVRTVESLKGPTGELHPVQAAMVECHGSQCGFCTPGFVMSLYALYVSERSTPSQTQINTWLAGNLCRCTGYGPIAAAAQRMFKVPRPEWDDAQRVADEALLASIADAETLLLEANGRRFFAPTSEDELATLAAAHPTATIISGATDVGLWITKQGRDLPVMIWTGRVAGDFAEVSISPGGRRSQIFIGAGVTHADAARALQDPTLGELWRRFAGLQVRNAGTVGGNIANGSPIGDLAPALIALDATLHLRLGGEPRDLPLENFFIAYGQQDRRPGEIVVGVSFPVREARTLSVHKVSKRFDDDISAVCAAFNIAVDQNTVTSARIGYGGMAAIPRRARAMEAALIGKPWTRSTVNAAMDAIDQDFQPISDARASAAYRREVAANLLLRVFIEHTEPKTATRLVGATATVGG